MGNVTWSFVKKTIQLEDITKIESVMGIRFPQDYIECVLENHGGTPSREAFLADGYGEAVFNYLLTFDPDTKLFILKLNDAIKDRLVEGVYPFANDPGGNFICFDYRETKSDSPKIVFWDHEVAFSNPTECLLPVCDNFTELLEMLYD